MLWKWIEKRTIRLTCREQMPGDAEDGLVGLGAGDALWLSSKAPQLFCHSFPLEIKGELPHELSLSWDTFGHVVVPKVLLPLCSTCVALELREPSAHSCSMFSPVWQATGTKPGPA